MPWRVGKLLVLILLAIVFSSAEPTSGAEPPVDQSSSRPRAFSKGVEYFGNERYEDALALFQSAKRDGENVPEAEFFIGACFNRLERFSEARAAFGRSEAAGYRNPGLDFEMGWSLLGIGRWNGAIDRLTRYEHSTPGRAQTHLFLALALLSLNMLDQAADELNRAENDPDLAASISLYRAMLERKRGNEAAARRDLRSASQTLGDLVFQPIDTLAGNVTRERLGTGLDADRRVVEGERPWWFDLTLAAGFNANARRLRPGERRAVPERNLAALCPRRPGRGIRDSFASGR